MDGCTQGVPRSGLVSEWRPVKSGVLLGLALGMLLFNIFTGDIEGVIECILSSFAEDTELCGVIDMLQAGNTILKDFHRLERWISSNLVEFSKTKSKVLHLGEGNPKQK